MELAGQDNIGLDRLTVGDIPSLDWAGNASARMAMAELLARCRDGRAEFLVLRTEIGEVVAKAAIDYEHRPTSGLLLHVATHPDFRRLGFASQLLAAAEQRIAERDLERAELNVELRNTPARTLYANLGYREFSRGMVTRVALCARGTRKMLVDQPIAAMAKPVSPR